MTTPSLPPPAAVAALPACTEVTVSLDGEGGAFNGMSHGGARLVIRNVGPDCRLPGLPRLVFADAQGRPLPVARRAPAGMHPGSVVLPVAVAAEAEATTPLRWVAGEVYPRSRCFTPVRLTVTLAPGATATYAGPIGRMCAPAGGAVALDQPPLRIDPRVGEPAP